MSVSEKKEARSAKVQPAKHEPLLCVVRRVDESLRFERKSNEEWPISTVAFIVSTVAGIASNRLLVIHHKRNKQVESWSGCQPLS